MSDRDLPERMVRAVMVCPWCGRKNNAHIGPPEDFTIGPGDVSLCIGCARPSVVNADGVLALPTLEQLADIDADPEIQKMRAALLRLPPPLPRDRQESE